MKKLLIGLFSFSVLFTIFSCENDPEIYDSNNGSLVYYTKGTVAKYAVSDNGEDVELFVEVGATTKVDFNRKFTIEILEDDNLDDDIIYADSDHFTIDQSSLIIPANSYVGSIKLTTNFNRAPDNGSVYLKLKLTSIENGIVLNESNIFTYELYRSCPKNIATSYIGFPSYMGVESMPTFQVSFTPVAGQENTWVVPTAWGPNAVSDLTGSSNYNGQYLYPGELVIKCDNTVSFTGTSANLTGGTGTYDPNTGVITIVLNQELFTNPFTVTTQFYPL